MTSTLNQVNWKESLDITDFGGIHLHDYVHKIVKDYNNKVIFWNIYISQLSFGVSHNSWLSVASNIMKLLF